MWSIIWEIFLSLCNHYTIRTGGFKMLKKPIKKKNTIWATNVNVRFVFAHYAVVNIPRFRVQFTRLYWRYAIFMGQKGAWWMKCARAPLRCKIHFIPAAASRLDTGVSRNSVKHYSTLHFTKVESTWWIIPAASSCRVGGGGGGEDEGAFSTRGIAVGGIAARVHYPLELSHV